MLQAPKNKSSHPLHFDEFSFSLLQNNFHIMVAEAVAAANFLLLTFCSPPFSHLVLVRKGLSSTKRQHRVEAFSFSAHHLEPVSTCFEQVST
jgi:hypothetical protein